MSQASENKQADAPSTNLRRVKQTVLATETSEGAGARVRRALGSKIRNLDPFLLLDEFYVTPPAGFPNHPHRGFETVTYMLDGSFKHKDFTGRSGVINPGDIQWMTAGKGIVHSEMPATAGVNHGLQLWVNLAKKHKMTDPQYQELASENIPTASRDGVWVKIIAGQAMGVSSAVFTRTPTMYLDFKLEPNAAYTQEVPESYNGFVYVMQGSGTVSGTQVRQFEFAVLDSGNAVELVAGDQGLRCALIAGQPLGEPVVQHGPFVMNTQEEIAQTFNDYRMARNGFEAVANIPQGIEDD